MLLLALGGVVGCEPYPTFKYVPLDCTADDGWDFHTVSLFETAGDANALWAPAGDPFCGGVDGGPPRSISLVVEPIEGGPRCGSSNAALVFRAERCNDWGALVGFSNFGPRDESAYQGMSFWARAPGSTAKGFTIVLDDANTLANTEGTYCKNYDGGVPGQTTASTTDPGTGAVISGSSGVAPLPDQCGNGYSTVVAVTGEWRFYTIPFGEFTQPAQPNRVPNPALSETGGVPGTGLLTSKLWALVFRLPKETRSELWIDELSFYRRKGAAAGVDGGAGPDAAQR